MKKPQLTLSIKNKEITNNITHRLSSLRITDNRGITADQLSFSVNDNDGQVELPERGVEIDLSLGFDDGVILQNRFVVDGISYRGAPDQISINASSAHFKSSWTEKQEHSYDLNTFEELFMLVAKRQKTDIDIAESLKQQPLGHYDQTEESDAAFLLRVAKEFDAFVSFKMGKVLVLPMGTGKTLSGRLLPKLIFTRDMVSHFSLEMNDRESYTGVVANWMDYRQAKKSTRSGKNNVAKQQADDAQSVLIGEEGHVKTLRKTYSNKEEANQAAKTEWKNIQRAAAQLTLQLAEGRPDLCPEMPVSISGYKQSLDELEWIISQIEHSLDNNGFVSTLHLEPKVDLEVEKKGT